MAVFARAFGFLLALTLFSFAPLNTAAANDEALKKIEQTVNDVFSGKLFQDAFQQAKAAHERHKTQAAKSGTPWPFYIPDASKPRDLNPDPVPLGPVAQTPKPKPVLASPKVRNTQVALNTLGFDTGVPDGVYGRKTAQAVERYQRMVGVTVTGSLSDEQRTLLLAAAEKKRQLAALQTKAPESGDKAHTVVNKQSAPLPQALPNSSAKQGLSVTTASSTAVEKRPLTSLDEARASLPENAEASPFDADDPDDKAPAKP